MPYRSDPWEYDDLDVEVLKHKKKVDEWWCGQRDTYPKASKKVQQELDMDDAFGSRDRSHLEYRAYDWDD